MAYLYLLVHHEDVTGLTHPILVPKGLLSLLGIVHNDEMDGPMDDDAHYS